MPRAPRGPGKTSYAVGTNAVSFVSTKHADAAVLGYPVRGEILQGFSSPDEVNNGTRIGESVMIISGVV